MISIRVMAHSHTARRGTSKL